MASPEAPSKEYFLAALRPNLTDEAWSWVESAVARASLEPASTLRSVYTGASRRVGRQHLGVTGLFAHWLAEDAARAAFLLARAEQTTEEQFVIDATECYEQGDSREQQSWLRGVGALPYGHRFAPVAIDACRSNILPLFEAIACENPYPAEYFSDLHFNQMVLKAMFNSIALSRVVGLPGRLNDELTRMAGDYASERRAAGRPVPTDISLAMGVRGAAQETR